jgi:hypothetical protein
MHSRPTASVAPVADRCLPSGPVNRRFHNSAPVGLAFSTVSALLLFSGCAGSAVESSSERPARLPSVLGARWAAPDFATRIVDADRAAALDAVVASANALGYSVNRIDGALGKISAARRQTPAFDGARQDTLEISVATLAPGSTKVAVTLRETIESGSGDERSGGMVTTALVRDRAPYDAFFARLAEALGVAPTPAS